MLLQTGRPIYLTTVGELEPGSVFAGHRIEAVAGRGGMGVVYRATQLALDRTVALKVIAPGLLEDQTVRSRFVRESKVAASIDHPNVIPIYYAGDEHGIAYIAMRYVAGDDIRSLVRREGHLTPERAARIVAQLGSALDEAHAAGLVHRDIKPANVLLTAEDHVYLTDFGLTKHALSVAGTTKPGHWVGTLDYVAPEQIRGERIDARADVYALGCLLFFTLTGIVPFRRDSDEARLWAHLSEPPPKPTDLVPEIPSAFDYVIERALAKDPEERYQSAGDLGRAALAAAANQRPAERERLVAKGAAAPVESPTVTAAPRPPAATAPREAETQLQPEAETAHLNTQKTRRPVALIVAGILVVGAIGVFAAFSQGGGNDGTAAKATATPTRTATATAAAAGPKIVNELTVGHRPNIVLTAGGNVFVGSFSKDRMSIVSAATAKLRSYAPRIGIGASDAVASDGSVWVASSRTNQIVRLDARTGRPIGHPIRLPFGVTTVAVTADAIWAGLQPGNLQPDQLVRIDRKTGDIGAPVSYPYGIRSMTASPTALWISARRRALIQRVDIKTGTVVKPLRIASGRSDDLVYSRGSLWAAVGSENTVYKVSTSTFDAIPIDVGGRPLRLAVTDDTVYVTNYSSSDLTMIDSRSSRVIGDPFQLSVTPFPLSADEAGKTLWVGSVDDSRLTEIATGRGG
ncbi:protein kinase [Solirubrobacter ginsenosidimutans]|uniref:non-specific serine/threonine protein kinase n=1 Tax=Solirubrobacter ginsenosidimutans TaxID=490573 RepID=A0A9X3S217_9ACTN|nr:protein kinase [Solirubrobacter ginsenosidimutans]MDA0161717.1 protein kinase [Solirubrobacter ginsenosidimutans]